MKLWQSILLKIVLGFLGLVVTFLPRSVELKLGPYLGKFLYCILRKRRNVAAENIHHCFPQADSRIQKRLLHENFEHYGILIFELLHLFSPFPNHYRNYVRKNSRLIGLEHFQKAQAHGKGILFVSSHLGNWEFMVAAGGLAGMKLTMVTKHLKPEWLHQKIEKTRLSVGAKAAYEPRTLPLIMRALKNNEAVGFVMDQYAGPPIGVPVHFFGVKVGTLNAVGTLCARTGAIVLPVCTSRLKDGTVLVSIEPPMHFENEKAIHDVDVTQSIASHVEAWVRRSPNQWLWIHRRFKNVVW